MGRVGLVLLYCSLFLTYTQGLWERIFSFSSIIENIVEGSVLLFILFHIKTFFKKNPAKYLFICFLFLSFIATIVNQSGFVLWIKFIRSLIYFYLIYSIFWNRYLSNTQWSKLIMFIVSLIIIQGLGAAINIYIFNIRVEGYVGLMSTLGGTIAATFPLLIISIAIVLFMFIKVSAKKFKIALLLMVISALLVGFASAKRAIYFSIPIFIIISLLITAFFLSKYYRFYRKLFLIFILTCVFIPFYLYGVRNSGGINSGLQGGESLIKTVNSAYEYALQYTESETEEGYSAGRSATTRNIFNQSTHKLDKFLFGFNYSANKESQDELKLVYGIVGFTRDLVSGGFFVMLITIFLILKMILSNKSQKYHLTQSIRIVLAIIFLYTHFTYSPDFTVHLKFNYLLAIFLSLINSPIHSNSLSIFINKFFYKTS